jgi:hypothetical protein
MALMKLLEELPSQDEITKLFRGKDFFKKCDHLMVILDFGKYLLKFMRRVRTRPVCRHGKDVTERERCCQRFFII